MSVPRPAPGGLGLAAQRLGLGPATLQTLVHDHVSLRTPTRPAHGPGNALHLFAPPEDLEAACTRFDRSVGNVPGVPRRVVAWQTDGPDDDPRVEVPGHVDLQSHEVGVLAPDVLPDVPSVPAGVELVRAERPEHWAGAKVLYLQTDWEGDEPHWRWLVDQQRQVVEAGGGTVLVAYQLGLPVGRAGLFVPRDGTAGVGDRLAVVEDAVVHPLYRRQGIGTALVLALTDVARRLLPGLTVVVRSDPDGPSSRWVARLGFAPTARTWTATTSRR